MPFSNSCEADHNGKGEFHDLAKRKRSLEQSGIANRFLSCIPLETNIVYEERVERAPKERSQDATAI